MLRGKPLGEVFQFLHDEGCTSTSILQEVMDRDIGEKTEAAAVIRQYGMTLCVHGNIQPALTPDRNSFDIGFLQRMYDEIDWWQAETGGLIYDCCSDSVYGNGENGRAKIETSFDLFSRHADHFENTGILYGIENTCGAREPHSKDYYNCDERFQEAFDRFGSRKGAAILLDVGHAYVASLRNGWDFETFLDSIPFEFCEIHVTDNHGKDDEHLKPGEGTLDFKALKRSLDKRAFDGPVNMETCPDIIHSRWAFDISNPEELDFVRDVIATGKKLFFGE